MFPVFTISLKGLFRDRIAYGILSVALVLIAVPLASSLSMRIVTELSITLSLSLISFILLLLAVFLGGTSLWKDMDKRYSFSVLGLPLGRGQYLLGKFLATALFLLITTSFLGLIALGVIYVASGIYPPLRPVQWNNIAAALLFDFFKYVLLIAIAYLFSTVSTSFFLPLFGAIVIFFVGSASQEAYDFVHMDQAADLAPMVKKAATALYYILPNFSAFDLKVNAIYGVPLSPSGLMYTTVYFFVYTLLVLSAAVMVFTAREMK
jgi:ABC-type transport system involved in multi-copper enzyme maturation permease subunit